MDILHIGEVNVETIKLSLGKELLSEKLSEIRFAQETYTANYPGDEVACQPVHTVYGGAHLFRPDTPLKLGQIALKTFDEYALDFTVFARAIGLPCVALQSTEVAEFCESLQRNSAAVRAADPASWLAAQVYSRVQHKLRSHPLEDYRIDFEDGYGVRSDEEEDDHALCAATALAQCMRTKSIPPFTGIRVKAFTEELFQRSARTLDLFITRLVTETGGSLPPNFAVTLPKAIMPSQVQAFVAVLSNLESELGIKEGAIRVELMIEAPQSVINHRGEVAVPHLVAAAGPRCRGVHFGAYDYTAACDVSASHQALDHQYCNFARSVIKTALAGTGVWLSDGATTLLPVGPNRETESEPKLSSAQKRENMRVVHDAWRLSFRNIQWSLEQGFYQGWDLHPSQLPVRFAASYTFFLQNLSSASRRLKAFLDKAAQATLDGNSFDDAATGQGLLNFFLRGLNCGALTPDDLEDVGLTHADLQSRSFVKILQSRRQQPSLNQ